MAGSRNFTIDEYMKMAKENMSLKDDLIKAYGLARESMLDTLSKIALGQLIDDELDFTTQYNSVIAQVDNIVADLNAYTADTLEELIPRQFALGQVNASMQLSSASIPVALSAGTFSIVDQNAVKAIVMDTYEDLFRSNMTMSDTFKRTLRQIAKEEVTKNVISGDTIKYSSQKLKARLLEQGFAGFTKKNGQIISSDEYSALVLHTKTMQAHNDGTTLFMAQEGYDLVQVSNHKTACKTCQKYEKKIYSISGKSKKYPPISEMPNSGPPFHPRCRHVLKPYLEQFHDGSLDEDFDFDTEINKILRNES